MHLGYHGGKCCGIKHIRGFPYTPNRAGAGLASPLDDSPMTLPNSGVPIYDGGGNDLTQGSRFYPHEAPMEEHIERLDRYIDYVKSKRPGGIIEVVLMDYQGRRHAGYDQLDWIPKLEDRGFRFVSRCYNSNSSNYIYVFHLCIEPEDKVSATNIDRPLFPWETFGFTPPKAKEAIKAKKVDDPDQI